MAVSQISGSGNEEAGRGSEERALPKVMLYQKIGRRLAWYQNRVQVNNPFVGRLVELTGDKVRMEGLTFSVASPNISRGHKGTLAFGLHEMEERALVRKWLPRDLPAIELGGGLGVVSCLTNRLLNNPERHVVVEANPYMVPVLLKNRDLNRCRFAVLNKAVAYDCETVELPIDPEFVGSSLSVPTAKTVTVEAATLAELIDDEPVSLIADIEGAEEPLILREIPTFKDRIGFAMFELHPYVLGEARTATLMRTMADCGFQVLERLGGGDVFCVAWINPTLRIRSGSRS